jgi:flagellar assembly protein FliH
LYKSKIIKAPVIKDEICFVDPPDLVTACHELAAAIEEEEYATESTDQGQEVTAEAAEETQTSIDPEEVARQLISDAERQAEELLDTARQEAERLLAKTESRKEQVEQELAEARQEAIVESERLKKEAYDQGYQEGLAAGYQAGEAEWTEKVTAAEDTLLEAKAEALNLINQAEEERTARIQESEQEILKLVVDIAEKVIKAELSGEPRKWLTMINDAAKTVAGATEITISIAQEDEAFLIQHLREIRSQFTESPRIHIKTDHNLQSGDFLLQSNLGEVDARIHQQLAKIFQTLKQGRELKWAE